MTDMITGILADAGGTMVTLEQVAYLLGAAITAFATASLGKKKGRAEMQQEMTVDFAKLPQPMLVRMAEEFVTRREFDQYTSDTKGTLREIKGAIEGTMAKVESLFVRLTEKVEDNREAAHKDTQAVATAAYNGRQKIWEELNPVRERLAKVEERNHVQVQIGEAIATAIRKEAKRP